jgi:hypothetical protein
VVQAAEEEVGVSCLIDGRAGSFSQRVRFPELGSRDEPIEQIFRSRMYPRLRQNVSRKRFPGEGIKDQNR